MKFILFSFFHPERNMSEYLMILGFDISYEVDIKEQTWVQSWPDTQSCQWPDCRTYHPPQRWSWNSPRAGTWSLGHAAPCLWWQPEIIYIAIFAETCICSLAPASEPILQRSHLADQGVQISVEKATMASWASESKTEIILYVCLSAYLYT